MDIPEFKTSIEWSTYWDAFLKPIHMSAFRPVHLIQCPACDKSFDLNIDTLTDLANHIVTKHKFIAPPKEPDTCSGCRFSIAHGSSSLTVCKRQPPQIDFKLEKNIGFWPSVDRGNWCGEWEAKNA